MRGVRWWTPLVAIMLVLPAPGAATKESGTQVAFDTIAGALPKVVRNTGRPYLVVADIEVPSGRLVTVEPGNVFLFTAFAGLHVQGRLEVRGQEEAPVVFTSENDQEYNAASSLVANPYDWNGIYIHADALGTELFNVVVSYSVYGVVAETKFIRVEPGLFTENGKSNLVIEGVEHVDSGGAYTYVLSTKDAVVDGVPVKLLRDPAAPRRNVMRYAGLALLAGGCGLGIYETVQAGRANDELERLSNTNIETAAGLDNLRYHDQDDWEDAQAEHTRSVVGSVAGFVLGAFGSFGVAWSFTF